MNINLNDINLNDYADLPTENLYVEQKKSKGRDFVLSPNPFKAPKKTNTITVRFLPRLGVNAQSASLDDLLVKELSYTLEYNDGNKWTFSSEEKTCPIMKKFYEYKNSKNDVHRSLSANFSRKTDYFALVYVINDVANPENNGKYMFYKFGKGIYKTLKNACSPTEEEKNAGVIPLNFWDLKNGATFVINTKIDGEFPNFDNSKFLNPSPFTVDEAKNAAKNNIFTNAQMQAEFKQNWLTNSEKFSEFGFKEWSDLTHQKWAQYLEELTGERIDLSKTASNVAVNAAPTKSESLDTPVDDIYSGLDSSSDDLPF